MHSFLVHIPVCCEGLWPQLDTRKDRGVLSWTTHSYWIWGQPSYLSSGYMGSFLFYEVEDAWRYTFTSPIRLLGVVHGYFTNYMQFKWSVHTNPDMNIYIFWDVGLCRPVNSYWRFKGPQYFRLEGQAVKAIKYWHNCDDISCHYTRFIWSIFMINVLMPRAAWCVYSW